MNSPINRIVSITLSCMFFFFSGSFAAHAIKTNSNLTIKITNILPTELFYTGKANDLLWRDTCDNWTLSAKQIEQFFQLSNEYIGNDDYINYAQSFNWSHCSIMGTLKAENSHWDFEINASGAAEWRNGNSVRTFGCSSSACQELLIPEQNKPVIPPNPATRILEVHPAEYDKRYDLVESSEDVEETYCKSWGLTAQQVEYFFKISDEYLEGHFRMFYWLPCNVNGVLESEGRKWQFSINQAGSGIWRDGDVIRLWGCSADECKSLNLIMTDDSSAQIAEK